MSMWPRENRPEDTHGAEQTKQESDASNTGPVAGMWVSIAKNLPSLGLQVVNKNTRFLCLLFMNYIG